MHIRIEIGQNRPNKICGFVLVDSDSNLNDLGILIFRGPAIPTLPAVVVPRCDICGSSRLIKMLASQVPFTPTSLYFVLEWSSNTTATSVAATGT